MARVLPHAGYVWRRIEAEATHEFQGFIAAAGSGVAFAPSETARASGASAAAIHVALALVLTHRVSVPTRRGTALVLAQQTISDRQLPFLGSNLIAQVAKLQLELPALECRHHAAEFVPGDLATIDDDTWYSIILVGIAIDGAAQDQAIVHVRPMVSVIEMGECQSPAHLADKPAQQLQWSPCGSPIT